MALIEPLISTQSDAGGGGSLGLSGGYLQDGGVDVDELGVGQIVRVGKATGSASTPYLEVFNQAGDGKVQVGCEAGAYTSSVLFATGGYNLRIEDPGNANAPVAYGKVLGSTTEAVVFNGNTTGATSETTILTGTLNTNSAAPGMQVAMQGVLTIDAVNGADTLTLRLKRGGSAILTVALEAADIGGALISWYEIIQSIGASGNIYRISSISGDSTNGSDTGARTLNTTTNQTYALTAQWSSNNAGNQATFNYGYVHYKM